MFLMLRQSGTTARLRLHVQKVNQDPKNSNSLGRTKRKGVKLMSVVLNGLVGWEIQELSFNKAELEVVEFPHP